MRLLIVEDEKQICDMVAKSLYAAGYEVDMYPYLFIHMNVLASLAAVEVEKQRC